MQTFVKLEEAAHGIRQLHPGGFFCLLVRCHKLKTGERLKLVARQHVQRALASQAGFVEWWEMYSNSCLGCSGFSPVSLVSRRFRVVRIRHTSVPEASLTIHMLR